MQSLWMVVSAVFYALYGLSIKFAGAEGVGAEQGFLRGIIGHHDLRPVDHRGHDEGEGMPAGRERVHFLNE